MHLVTPKKNTKTLKRILPNGQEEETTYTFDCINARQAGRIGARLAGKVVNGIAAFGLAYSGDNGEVGSNIDELFDDETIDKLYELIFDPKAKLHANGSFIQDPDVFFQGRLMEMYTLMGYALRCNCEDFFTTVSGYLNKNPHLSEMLNNLKKSPETVIQQMANHFQTSSEENQKEEKE